MLTLHFYSTVIAVAKTIRTLAKYRISLTVLFSCSDQGFNKQKGKLLSPDASLLSHLGNSRIHFGNLRKEKGKLLTHFSRFRKQKGKLLTHFSISRIHFSNFRKQIGKWLAHFSNFRIQDDSFSREKLF